ncbi:MULTISPECIES: YhcN/YlaJ family sporulation lipoprotein [Paenibacillus]|uniref:YhcN/YlaJ family sporulation lipoprotein n=1 Tax=Paenibacillus TaxID=44249 RepID=UPI0022B88737|nr:YhcN/YlaJ family sporulation lipoprotein [Paenibacillus caseinilyticus]MCZ8521532.1 YhcN/YlaJ family sporulation lipoprotein [Paenibacillus caseinilyticus]
MKNAKNRSLWILALLSVVMLSTAACGGNKPQASSPGTGLQDYRQQQLFDRDSRNNEDGTLGVKERYRDPEAGGRGSEYTGRKQLDMTNRHEAKSMGFSPLIAERLKSLNGVAEAQVLLTEVNAYAAIVLDGHSPDAEANPEMMKNGVSSKGGAGLFGQGSPLRFSWTEEGGLTSSKADEIRKAVLAAAPTNIQEVFVSANPNFVQRIRFYAKEEGEKGSFSQYTNEFQTMLQHVFPDNVNTRR